MVESLQKKAIHGLAWSTLERLCYQFLQFLLAVLLARFLQPSEFGLIAMVSFFIAISQSFVDSGFGAALVQRQKVSRLDECSVFYFNIAMGALATATLYTFAPWIAAFYGQPILTSVIRCLAFLLIINSFGSIQLRMILKQMDFKTLFHVNAISYPIAGIVGVLLAYAGYGIWSLVCNQLLFSLLNATLLWRFVDWRPSWLFSFRSLWNLFGFGSKMLATGMLETVFQNMYELVIGKFFTPDLLGYYSRARSTQQLIATNMHITVARVTFPVFSSIQNDMVQLRSGVRKGLCFIGIFNFPIMVGMAVVADPLIKVVYTPKWLPSSPYLQLLCLVGLLHPLAAINTSILSALGRSDLTLRLEVIKKGIAIALLAGTLKFGILPIVLGQVAAAVIGYLINCYFTSTLIGYSVRSQFQDLIPVLSLALAMGAIVSTVGRTPFPNPFFQLITQACVGVFSFVILCRLSRIETYQTLENWVWNKLGGFRGTASLKS